MIVIIVQGCAVRLGTNHRATTLQLAKQANVKASFLISVRRLHITWRQSFQHFVVAMNDFCFDIDSWTNSVYLHFLNNVFSKVCSLLFVLYFHWLNHSFASSVISENSSRWWLQGTVVSCIVIMSECWQAWVGHPYYDVIDNSTDFEHKVVRMIAVSLTLPALVYEISLWFWCFFASLVDRIYQHC